MANLPADERIGPFKPCPHCGKHLAALLCDKGDWHVVCDASGHVDDPNKGCGASGGFATSSDEAIEKWNRRVSS